MRRFALCLAVLAAAGVLAAAPENSQWQHTVNKAHAYLRSHQDPAGLDVLRQGGVEVAHYNRWRELWR